MLVFKNSLFMMYAHLESVFIFHFGNISKPTKLSST